MMKSGLFNVVCFIWFALIFLGSARAGTIFLSGDINIVDGMYNRQVDGETEPPDQGNIQFFTNILQGGSNVSIYGESVVSRVDERLNDFYNGLDGVSSSIVSAPITNSTFSGVNLFVSSLPTQVFSQGAISFMSSFLDTGGAIMFLGDWGDTTGNAAINDALINLGSTMRLLGTTVDLHWHTATGDQIATDPLTTGVSTLSYGAASEVVVSGGTALFYGTGAEPFFAYETSTVPIPPSVWLFGSGLLGLIGVARRKRVH